MENPMPAWTICNIPAGVAVLILLIVSFTYINVNTAWSIERAREVGVRKVVGSSRQNLLAVHWGIILPFVQPR